MGVDFSLGKHREVPSHEEALTRIHDCLPPVDQQVEPERAVEVFEQVRQLAKAGLDIDDCCHDEWERHELAYDERAHFAYSGFNRFRTVMCKAEGINLQEMEGFHPGHGKSPRYSEEPPRTTYPLAWENVKTALVPFYNHSDCDGEIGPEDCAAMAQEFREVVERAFPEGDPLDSYDREQGLRLAGMMELAGREGLHLLFR